MGATHGKYKKDFMSRPKPKILLNSTNINENKKQLILHSNGLWVVLYQNKPFSFKTEVIRQVSNTPKYKKTCFPNPGHAYNLAKKLNLLFNCNDFSVKQVL